MSELRHIETNSADDSSGRAFGLEGNLYLPVLLAMMSGLVLFAILGVLLGINYGVAAAITSLPVAAVIAWVLLLKQGKPKGYDRDLIEQWLGGADFTRIGAEQGGLVE